MWISRCTVVDGLTPTGLYAADGSYNVVVSNPAEVTGIYHPCGGYWVTSSADPTFPVYAPNGSLYIAADVLAA